MVRVEAATPWCLGVGINVGQGALGVCGIVAQAGPARRLISGCDGMRGFLSRGLHAAPAG